ncbi:cystatin-C [Brachyhypopomus gauderio]|uniref:cystatin-C n=1 Tax=Brachyhypopomus gauderio TaxID=698409 RepID=UPI0040438A03
MMGLYLILVFSLISVFHLSHGEQPVVEEIIIPRKAQLLGGWNEANPESEEVREAAQKAVEKFNMKSKAKYYFKLLNIISAQTQVTNMINFNIEATIVKTECLKSEPADLGSCALGGKLLTCKSEVQFNPRKMQYVAKRVSCKK